jgi:exo-beta-1,3-glucanase (GH17 family)
VHLTRAALFGFLSITLLHAGAARAVPARCAHGAASDALERLSAAMRDGRFVAYEPTSLQVVNGNFSPAQAQSIRADLAVLRRRFDALITYDAIHGAEQIPALASELRFRALIVGVWNPASAEEVDAALQAARRYPQLVVGISLGNETIFSRRSDPKTLAASIARLRERLPATAALTTTEPFHIFRQPEAAVLLEQLDFLLVNVHPIFQPWFRDASAASAAQFVVNVLASLAPLSCGPVLVKETGEPSAPQSAGFSPERQAAFYRELRQRLPPSATSAFAYFAAFDAPWRAYDAGPAGASHEEEAHFGLYDAERHAKPAAIELPPLPRERKVLKSGLRQQLPTNS